MKTKIINILIILTTSTLCAQNLSLGGELGFISSTNNYDFTDLDSRRHSYYTGLDIVCNHNNRLSFTFGLHYLRQGDCSRLANACFIFEEGAGNKLVRKIDYVSFPVTISLHLLKSHKLITVFGLYGGHNIKAIKDWPVSIKDTCNFGYIKDLTVYTKKCIVGGIAGFGYKIFENDKLQLTPMIKCYQGFSNTYEGDNWYNTIITYNSFLITLTLNYRVLGEPNNRRIKN